MNKFESIQVFKDAHTLVIKIYEVSSEFPDDERFGLISQVRRSAASVPANIIEGNSRNHKKEFIEFLYFAKGSLEETKYHLLLARDLKYLDLNKYNDCIELANSVGKQITGLIHYLKN